MKSPKSLLLIVALLCFWGCNDEKDQTINWPDYLGGPDRNHFSALTQIDSTNVQSLEIAWTYATKDSGQIQANPLIIDGILYGVSPTVQAFALDAETGKELWTFGDPLTAWHSTSRGLAYWSDGGEARIFHSIGPHLYCLDAATGQAIESFGDGGKIDLHAGLPEVARDKFIISNTPGTIFEDLIIMPVRVSEDAGAAPGDIRAFNVETGELAWTFHTIPHPGEFGYESFPSDAYLNDEVGGANNWAGMSVDVERGMLFVPTGSAAYDFYGGNRPGENLFANCLLALDARTGERIWHYQTTHHDVWDRDLPAPPNLITVQQEGKSIDAVAQITKQGYVFVFDRETGTPLFPIDEVEVPASEVPGEMTWPTQPVPRQPAPFARQDYTIQEDGINHAAPDRAELLERLASTDRRPFAPPGFGGTLMLPGFDGGAEWGGAAADPDDGVIYINSNDMPWILTMVPTQSDVALAEYSPGERIYRIHCSSCHGADLKGSQQGNFPELLTIGDQLDRSTIAHIISNGKGMMPGMAQLSKEERNSVIDFILGLEKIEAAEVTTTSEAPSLPFKSTGYHKFLDADGHPAITPPWGTLSAIDLNSGNYRWQIPLGNEPGWHEPGSGTENYGGPIVTASGLLFIGATKDGMFRAFDKRTGRLLWEVELPAPAFATPSTYQVNGKQYIVIACGGTKLGTKKGNQYVAFSL
ncbi:pyrrolo-quinoline quinone [Lewinellaceae bacterium SD302]|nr:pyrrolo-quinoline quinone [Lewinellaceae bacterium SD302]